MIRDLRPEVRIVADLDNPAVAHAVEEVLGSVGVLDVAALFAPAVVEACLGRLARDILLGDTLFVAAEVRSCAFARTAAAARAVREAPRADRGRDTSRPRTS